MKQKEEFSMARRKRKNLGNHFKNIIILAFAIIGFMFCMNSFAKGADELKFVHISDVHFSKELENTPFKMLRNSPELFDDAIEQINEIPNLSFVMFGGDLVDKAKDTELEGFLDHAKNIKSPWYFTFGNHDSMLGGSLTTDKYLAMVKKANPYFKYNSTYYSFSPQNGYKVIVLDSIIRDRLTSNGEIEQTQLDWLDSELASSQKQIVLIFLHVPIVEPYHTEHHQLLNDKKVFDVIGKYKNPIAIFQGHYHASKIKQINNILVVSTPALVSYPSAFREIKITKNDDKVIFDIKTKNTRLESIQKQAKFFIVAPELTEGEENDRDGIYTISKRK